MNLIERLRAEHARNGGQGAYAWSSRELCGKAATEIERLTAQVEAMREAALDALSGWRYIRDHHGDLYGVGWERVENALAAALSYRGGD